VPTDPDYAPSVNPGKENAVSPGCSSSMARFQRAQRRSKTALVEKMGAEAMEQQRKLRLSAVIHDHGTLAKHGLECCDERLTVKAPGHSEFMKIGELDKIISVDIGMLYMYMYMYIMIVFSGCYKFDFNSCTCRMSDL
jgi:hypothetical protein